MPSPKMRPPLTPKKGKVPVLLSSLPNKSALVTDSEDDSDDNETFHDTETIPDEAHAPMPPSPLSPRRTCASGPDSSSTRATQTAATIVQAPASPPHALDANTPSPRPHRNRPFVRAILPVPITGPLTVADLPSSSPFARTTPHPYPSTASDTPLLHARFFFVIY